MCIRLNLGVLDLVQAQSKTVCSEASVLVLVTVEDHRTCWAVAVRHSKKVTDSSASVVEVVVDCLDRLYCLTVTEPLAVVLEVTEVLEVLLAVDAVEWQG